MEIKRSKGSGKTTHDYLLVGFGMFIVLMVVLVQFYGTYLRGESDSRLWWSTKVQELIGNAEENAIDGSASIGADAVLVDEDLRVMANEERSVFEVWNFGNKIGEIRAEHSAVSLFKRDSGRSYLGIRPDGLGGYILFGGPSEVYRVDESSLTKVYDGNGKNGFASDVANDKLVAIEDPSAEGKHPSVAVYDLKTQKSQSYPVPARYGFAGEAYFFAESDKQLTYEAAIGDPDNEEYALYLIDLTTGKQTQVGNVEKFD